MPLDLLRPAVAFVFVLATAADADPALARGDERGRAIAAQVDASDADYVDEVVSGTLKIRASDGTTARRLFTMSTLEQRPGGDLRAVVFHEPRDLAGFVSLNHSEILKPDRQWIYLPRLNRTRRLSARDKTGSFAGSEFAYEDIVRWELERYDYRYVGAEPCEGASRCEVIENLPRYEFSGYSKLVETVNMDILQPIRIEYHDPAGRHFKTLEFFDYEQFQGYWRARRTVMTNEITGAVSEVAWSPYRYGTGLTAADFRVERIEAWAR